MYCLLPTEHATRPGHREGRSMVASPPRPEPAHSINWLRDQPFEQGMTIYIYIEIFTISNEKAWVNENWQK